jgi:phosphatidylserine/phosphatidylglycerophosphate/cardiolipin synthase-like enzyme
MGRPSFPLDVVFATDWFLETYEQLREDVQPYQFAEEPGDVNCQVVPSGPGFPDENNLRLSNSLIYSAQRRLSITSPHFVPDDSLLVEDHYRDLSHELTLEEWRRRPLVKRYVDNVMRLTSALQ